MIFSNITSGQEAPLVSIILHFLFGKKFFFSTSCPVFISKCVILLFKNILSEELIKKAVVFLDIQLKCVVFELLYPPAIIAKSTLLFSKLRVLS